MQGMKWLVSDEIFNSDFLNDRNWYVTNFSNSVNDALLGKQNGFIQFDGSKYQHIINTGSAGVAEVQTITLSGALTSASAYRIAFKGYMSADLAYNASTSAMATAFAALPSALYHPQGPLSAAFSATASAGTSVTVTITGPNGNIVQVDELVQIITDNGTAASAQTASTAITTYATVGFPSTATYQLYLYAFVFAQVVLDTNGKLQRTIL
jgi:hypothetical protein